MPSPSYGIAQAVIFLPCGFFYLSSSFFLLFFLAYSQPSQIGCLLYFHTWCGPSANLGCRSETCCTRLAENAGRKKSSSWHHRTTLSGYIFATKVRIDNRKNLLNSNISSTCPDNMANFGPLAAEIGSGVWGTSANFNGFRVLAALRHSSSGRRPNFAVLNRGRHLYSAGRPSRWALAHTLVLILN